MKFDKNLYVAVGLERRPIMMVKKSDENLRALMLNETVGKNCFLARTTPPPVELLFVLKFESWKNILESQISIRLVFIQHWIFSF